MRKNEVELTSRTAPRHLARSAATRPVNIAVLFVVATVAVVIGGSIAAALLAYTGFVLASAIEIKRDTRRKDVVAALPADLRRALEESLHRTEAIELGLRRQAGSLPRIEHGLRDLREDLLKLAHRVAAANDQLARFDHAALERRARRLHDDVERGVPGAEQALQAIDTQRRSLAELAATGRSVGLQAHLVSAGIATIETDLLALDAGSVDEAEVHERLLEMRDVTLSSLSALEEVRQVGRSLDVA